MCIPPHIFLFPSLPLTYTYILFEPLCSGFLSSNQKLIFQSDTHRELLRLCVQLILQFCTRDSWLFLDYRLTLLMLQSIFLRPGKNAEANRLAEREDRRRGRCSQNPELGYRENTTSEFHACIHRVKCDYDSWHEREQRESAHSLLISWYFEITSVTHVCLSVCASYFFCFRKEWTQELHTTR